jgi:anti-sigma factor RsiW
VSRAVSVSCEELRGQVSAYVDGELPALTCEHIERHCRSCADCAELVEGLRKAIGLCREAGHAPLPASVRARAQAHVRALLAKRRAPKTIRRRPRL